MNSLEISLIAISTLAVIVAFLLPKLVRKPRKRDKKNGSNERPISIEPNDF